jgi:RND superfamily putative drug exporter
MSVSLQTPVRAPPTGRVIIAAGAIMFCVFFSFLLGDYRSLKEFGFALSVAVLLDALVVRCLLLRASLKLLGAVAWGIPSRLESRLPRIIIEGPAPPFGPAAPAPRMLVVGRWHESAGRRTDLRRE